MNKNLNIEDIQKFTKYQLKINALRGGGNEQKQGIYNQKLNEYSERLQKSGVNTHKLVEIIQQGGDPTRMLETFRSEIKKKLTEVGGITKEELNAAVSSINQAIEKAVTTHGELKTEYGDYVKNSKAAFIDLYTTVRDKSDSIAKINDLRKDTSDDIANITDLKGVNGLSLNNNIDDVRDALVGLDELFRS